MKYINIPKKDNLTIDLSAITKNYKGIIIAYKKDVAVGRISYCSDEDSWYFYDNIDDTEYIEVKDTLLELINELIDNRHIADNFRLLEFCTNNNDLLTGYFKRSFA